MIICSLDGLYAVLVAQPGTLTDYLPDACTHCLLTHLLVIQSGGGGRITPHPTEHIATVTSALLWLSHHVLL